VKEDAACLEAIADGSSRKMAWASVICWVAACHAIFPGAYRFVITLLLAAVSSPASSAEAATKAAMRGCMRWIAIGPAWSEARLPGYGYAYEQAAKAKVTPRFLRSIEGVGLVAPMLESLRR
jgi:hypothetical protein